MRPTNVESKKREQIVKDSKVGTWFSLGVVGAVLLLTYFIVFGLYLARV
ncbi:hypothetical protein [Alkalihalobacillus sp. BA299]|nr:hypothetical protein [Alkalihalobacillus sp. BA299]